MMLAFAGRRFAGPLAARSHINWVRSPIDFDGADWTVSGVTVSANATAAPDGSVSADKLNETATTGTHLVLQSTSPPTGVSTLCGMYLKAAERTVAAMQIFDGTTNVIPQINLSTGVVTQAGTNATSSDAGNGWWFFSLTFTPVAATQIRACGYQGSISYAGTAGSGFYAWGAVVRRV